MSGQQREGRTRMLKVRIWSLRVRSNLLIVRKGQDGHCQEWSVKGSLVHGLTASKTMWELCRNLGFQTGGFWQEAGEDGHDSEHLFQGG